MKPLQFPFSGGISVFCIGLLTLVHFQHSRIWTVAGNVVCKSAECEQQANAYVKNMNQKIKPCNDFYEYVCHRWASENPRPKYETLWNVEKQMHLKTFQKLRKLLEDKKGSNEKEIQQATALYRRCREIPFLDRIKPAALKKIISKVAPVTTVHPDNKESLRDLPWWQIDKHYISLTGESAFFDFHFNAELEGDNRIITVINRPYSPYGTLKRVTGWRDKKEVEHYKSFLIAIIRSLGATSSSTSVGALEKGLDAVIKFREELRTLSRPLQPTLQTVIIRELQRVYNKNLKAAHKESEINWLELISAVHKTVRDPVARIPDTSVTKAQLDYFAQLADVLGRTPKSVIVSHIHLYFAERHIELSPQMRADLEGSYTDSAHPSGKIRHEPERWQTCIQSSNMKVAMARMYIQAYFPQKNEVEVTRLVQDTKRVLAQQISESLWLDAAAKNMTINKINAVTALVGAPTWYREPLKNTGRPAPNINPLDVEAFYSFESNSMFVSAVYLQSPAYSPNLPFVVDYGATVSLLAHEMYHAFDSRGISHPHAGIVSSWSPAMRSQFGVRLNCFKNQYRAYREKEFRAHGLPMDLLSRAPDTLDEDMADVMGLKLAYKAYLQKVKQNNGTCPIMRGFEKLGCDKLFFIAFVNDFCSASTSGLDQHFLLNDVHSSPRVRVNGAVANMEEFSRVFGCTDKDPLKLERTCDLWK